MTIDANASEAGQMDRGDDWLTLGDGEAFALNMGCGIFAIDQAEEGVELPHRVVLTEANVDQLWGWLAW